MLKFQVGQIVHTYLGWGHVAEVNCWGTAGNWYVVRFADGSTYHFPENQLCLD